MPEPSSRVLGQLLLAAGAVDDSLLAEALAEQRRTRERLGEVLVRRGTPPERVARALAEQLRLPYLEPPIRPSPDAVKLVDRSLAFRARIVPVTLVERALRVAMVDPLDAAAVADLQFQTGRRIEPAVTTSAAVDQALEAAYGAGAIAAVLDRIAKPEGAGASSAAATVDEVDRLRRASEAPPIVALVDLILGRAVPLRASDIHIEPRSDRLLVRARVDGVLRELLELPNHAGAAVASRIKIMAGLDIAVKRRPQDGRGAITVSGKEIGLRVSTLPTESGEKVVLRLLESANAGRRLADIGLGPALLSRFQSLLGRGHGVILTTGPTGSGKTTTLYAALAAIDRDRRNVITLEDPIEYRLAGISQVQVHRRAGLTFAAALRAVLRQDPDVIMVGEMRDRETVETGLAAALTGHLVLSTLHTNDAAGAVARLAEMRAPRYLIAGGLIGVLAQRLVRRLCERCRERRAADVATLRALGLPDRPVPLWEATGCDHCDGTGYHGRIGIYELLTVTARVRNGILNRAPVDALRDTARASGMESLALDAWRKVQQGLTTLDEVAPFLALIADETPICPGCGVGVRSGFLVCPGCGFRLRRRCACGATLEEGWRHCPACGDVPPPDRTGLSTNGLAAPGYDARLVDGDFE
ncbi:MAG TPA: ATPase, T2SS/T4P/T4SS family [Longimicrobiales bacterium]|nr:ATPase, T2SS/T4P/T4SS family [Longimicrobiales bacterium]